MNVRGWVVEEYVVGDGTYKTRTTEERRPNKKATRIK